VYPLFNKGSEYRVDSRVRIRNVMSPSGGGDRVYKFFLVEAGSLLVNVCFVASWNSVKEPNKWLFQCQETGVLVEMEPHAQYVCVRVSACAFFYN